MNKLQIVNEVLTKLREPTVASTSENSNSVLITQFVKETYREVCVSAEWSWLRRPISMTGVVLSFNSTQGGYFLPSLDSPNASVISVWNTTRKYQLRKANSLEEAQFMATTSPVSGPADFWFVRPLNTGHVAPRLVVHPTPVASDLFTVNLEQIQDIPAALDSAEIICPGYLLVLGAFEKALMERDGATTQQERATGAYRMALESAVSAENALNRTSTDWIPE